MGKTFTLHGGNSGGVYAKLVVTEQSQSIENNTTTLLWQFYMWNTQAKPNWYAYEQHNIIQVKINGIYVLNTSNFGLIGLEPEMTEATAELVTSGTTVINHNTDGSKTVDLSFYATQGWVNAYEWSGSQNSAALTTIARASQPTLSASSVTLGSPVTIYTNRASTGFTHTLEYSIGSASGTIASGVGDRYDDWKPSEELARQFPNVTSGTVTITCKTYNGSKHIGTETALLKVEISEDMVPSVSVVISEAASIPSGITGYIKTRSKLRIKVNASGSYGSSITSYKVTANGSTDNKSEIITGYLTTAGKNTITVTVTDSRGQPKTYETSVTVIDYAAPKISSLKAFRCDSAGNENVTGAYMKVVIAGAVTSLSSKNAKTCTLYYKKASATSWTSQTLTLSAYSFENVSAIVSADTSSSYNVRVAIGDSFSSAEYHSAVGTAQMFMNVLEDKSGAAIGKMAEKSGVLQLGWDLELKGDPTEDNHAVTKKYADTKQTLCKATIDLIGYNEGIWYPVTSPIAKRGLRKINVYAVLYDGDVPSWCWHNDGFYANLVMLVEHSGWGESNAREICLHSDYLHTDSNPIGYMQMGHASYAVLYLRGGGIYNIETDWDCSWAINTSDFTLIDEIVTLRTTSPGVICKSPGNIVANLVGNITGNAETATIANHLAVSYAFDPNDANVDNSKLKIYDSYNVPGTPSAYGNVLEINSCYSAHWKPQLWFGAYAGGSIFYRNRGYGDTTMGAWRMIDTVVASSLIGGTSNGWHYIKFDSGLAMCWATSGNVSSAFSSTWGSLYVHDNLFPQQTYPFSFTDYPRVFASPFGLNGNAYTTGDYWIYSGTLGSPSISPAFSAARPTKPSATITICASILAIGMWR